MSAMISKTDPPAIAKVTKHPKIRRWGIGIAVFLVIVVLLGFFVVPPMLKSVLISKLGEALHRDVTIESIDFNPMSLTLQVAGVSVRERSTGATGDEVFGLDSLKVNAGYASITAAGVVVKEIELNGPRANLIRRPDGSYNISDLIGSKGKEAENDADVKAADEKAADGKSDKDKTVENKGAEHAATEKQNSLPRFSISNIQINNGKITFDDGPEGVKHEVSDITLRIPFISTLPHYEDTYVEPHFSAKVNGAPLVLEGKSRPFDESHESELVLDLDNFELGRYLTYSPVEVPIHIPSGTLKGDLHLRFVQTYGKPSTLSLGGKLNLHDLNLQESGGAPLLAMKSLDVAIKEVDLVKRTVGIERVEITQPEVNVSIAHNGSLNWLRVIPKMPKEKNEESPMAITVDQIVLNGGVVDLLDQSGNVPQKASVREIELDAHNYVSVGAEPMTFDLSWMIDAGERLKMKKAAIKDGVLNLGKREVVIGEYLLKGGRAKMARLKDGRIEWFHAPVLRLAKTASKDKDMPWRVLLKQLRAEDLQLQFEDRAVSPTATQLVDLSTLKLENLNTDPKNESRLAMKAHLNKKGELSVDGAVKPMVPQGDLHIVANELELLPFQPYFAQFLNIALARGHIGAKGAVHFASAKDGFGLDYKGDLTLGNINMVDKESSSDLLKWKTLHVSNIDLHTKPLNVSMGEVALSDFYARVIIRPDGKLNLAQIVRKDESVAKNAPEKPAEGTKTAEVVREKQAAPPVPVKIGKVTLQGGNIAITDNFIKPNYSANLTKIGGRVNGLSSTEGILADLELRGSYDGLAPVNIKAKLNPFASTQHLNLDAEVKGVEMTSLSTYAGKYAGYSIERGKLSLFLKYRIENSKLTAENRVFLDQLTFGDPVENGPESKLPVHLAVSLLQNRRGEIDINLPIAGSLDDPQFSLGGIIFQVIMNVFTKAITSPFALIGSMFGGGEELAYVEFKPGYSSITPAMKERLTTISKILEERQTLKIELSGRIDGVLDREGLKHALMEARIKEVRRAELLKAGKEVGSLDEITIESKDYPHYLERAYKAEKFPKPRSMVGLVKELPVEEMEKLMIANMKAEDEDLRELAINRAKAVSEWLVGEGKVVAERVFTLQPHLKHKEGPQNDKASDSRVDFSLK